MPLDAGWKRGEPGAHRGDGERRASHGRGDEEARGDQAGGLRDPDAKGRERRADAKHRPARIEPPGREQHHRRAEDQEAQPIEHRQRDRRLKQPCRRELRQLPQHRRARRGEEGEGPEQAPGGEAPPRQPRESPCGVVGGAVRLQRRAHPELLRISSPPSWTSWRTSASR